MSGISAGNTPGPIASLSAPTLPIVIFDSVASVSAISMAITLAPAFLDSNIRRSKAWFNMIVNLMVFPLLYLLNAGHQFTKSPPPYGPCLLQAVFIYAAPPTATAAVLCHITDVALGLYVALFKKKANARLSNVLLFLPLTAFFFTFFTEILTLRLSETSLMGYDSAHMFCTAGAGTVHSRFSAALTVILLFVMLCMEAWIFGMLFRHWRTFKSFEKNHRDLRLSIFLRFGIFTLLVGGSGTLSAFLLPENMSVGALWNIFLVSVPLVAGFTFGTHKDILSTWAGWILCKLKRRVTGDVYDKPEPEHDLYRTTSR